MAHRADILMITHRSAAYLPLSLPRLLSTCGERDRVWLWQNGDDEETIEALRPFRSDPRVHRYHHSRENVRLREPTCWLWRNSVGEFVSKVDDDCLVTPGWLDTFAAAHHDNPQFGVIGSWRPLEEDLLPERAQQKVQRYNGGHQLLRNLWVQGSGYLMPRSLVDRHGLLREEESFTRYCIRAARVGLVNGFYYPFVREDHMDDPRSPNTLIHTDEDLAERMPLTARNNGVRTVEQWIDWMTQDAYALQTASLDPRSYQRWRLKLRRVGRQVRKFVPRQVHR